MICSNPRPTRIADLPASSKRCATTSGWSWRTIHGSDAEKVIGKVLGLDRTLEDTLRYIFALQGIQEGEDLLAQMDSQIRR